MTQMNIAQLFQPAPSGIGPQGSTATPTAGSWMAQNLANAATVGLTPTAWQPGSPSRSLLAVSAIDQAKQDAVISGMAQAGFLDFCASGTVTYVDPNGISTTTAVSPDPSNPSSGNTTGAGTWLDLLASSKYAVTRLPASPATPTITFVNTSGVTPPNYVPGTYHVQDSTNTSSTYSNNASLTIPPSTVIGGSITAIGAAGQIQITTFSAHGLSTGASIYITGAPTASLANGFWQVTVTSPTSFILIGSTAGAGGSGGKVYSTFSASFTADGLGTSYSSSPGYINTAVTTNNGVSVWNFAACTGVNYESNTALAARCRLKLQSLSVAGASGAYAYFAQTAYSLLQGSSTQAPVLGTSYQLQAGPITRTLITTNPLTGTVGVVVAPAVPQSPGSTTQGGAVLAGVTSKAISNATNANPIQITATAHGLTSGETISISGVLGNTAANGVWGSGLVVIDANNFTIPVAGTGTYTSGGTIEGGDLGLVDAVIQQYAVPDGDTAYTLPALAQLVAIAGNATVPAAQRTAYIANLTSLLTSYVNAMPIAGLPLSGGGFGLPIDVVIGLFYAAGSVNGAASYVKNISGVTINGSASDLTFSVGLQGKGVAVLYPAPSLTVAGA